MKTKSACIKVAYEPLYPMMAALGSTIEVWRGLRGKELSLVGKATNASVLSGESVALDSNLNLAAWYDLTLIADGSHIENLSSPTTFRI